MFRQDLFRSGRWHKTKEQFNVSALSATVTSDTSVVVEFYTTSPSLGQTEYDTDSGEPYASSSTESVNYFDYHQQVISGLTAGTTYYFRAKVTSQEGVVVYSDESSFTTTSPSSSTVGPRAAPATPVNAVVIGTDTVAVDDTGATDVTSTLQTIIDNLSAGDVLVFAQSDPEGFVTGTDAATSTYLISGSLLIRAQTNLTLWGYGAKLRMADGVQAEILELSRQDIDGLTIAGFELYGTNSAYSRTAQMWSGQSSQGSSGIALYRRHTNTTIEDCWIRHVNGDGVQQAAWTSLDWSGIDNITVQYNLIEDIKRQGINCNVGTNWLIQYNKFSNICAYSIDSEDTNVTDQPLPSFSATIDNNEFDIAGWWEYSTNYGCIHINLLWGWNNDLNANFDVLGPIYVRNNTFTQMYPDGIDLGTVGTPVIYNAKGANSASTGTWSDYTDRFQGVYIEDNVCDLPAAQQGSATTFCQVRASDTVVVDGNTLQSTTVDVPTDGYGYNTDVSGSDIP